MLQDFALLPTKTRQKGNPFKVVDWADRMSRYTVGGADIFNVETKVREGETVGGMRIVCVTDGFRSFAREHVEYYVRPASIIIRRARRKTHDEEIFKSLEETAESTMSHLWGMLERQADSAPNLFGSAKDPVLVLYPTIKRKAVIERIGRTPSWAVMVKRIATGRAFGLSFDAEYTPNKRLPGTLILSR